MSLPGCCLSATTSSRLLVAGIHPAAEHARVDPRHQSVVVTPALASPRGRVGRTSQPGLRPRAHPARRLLARGRGGAARTWGRPDAFFERRRCTSLWLSAQTVYALAGDTDVPSAPITTTAAVYVRHRELVAERLTCLVAALTERAAPGRAATRAHHHRLARTRDVCMTACLRPEAGPSLARSGRGQVTSPTGGAPPHPTPNSARDHARRHNRSVTWVHEHVGWTC